MRSIPSTKPHWIVSTHHRMRAGSFAYAFLFCGLYLQGGTCPAWAWGLLALQFLAYPHLAYGRALLAGDSRKAELNNLLWDSAFLGAWCAALGFPLWISFTLFISSAINSVISSGRRGLLHSVATFLAGAAAGLGAFGLRAAHQDPRVDWMCVLGLMGYLVGIGLIAYRRNTTLSSVRMKLKASEQAMSQANEGLQRQLAEIHVLKEQLHDQANRDSLTGLFNRRYLQATLERELARCRRNGTPMTLMMLDIDHFKSINDRYGHVAGDEVLRQMGEVLKNGARQEDVPCRFGGEEFVLLLPDMPLEVAFARAEILRATFAEVSVPSPRGEVRTTVSIGVATFPRNGNTVDELTHSADLALYAAKRHGRNGVRAYRTDFGAIEPS